MLAARFDSSDRSLELKDVPRPDPGPLEVVVKVDSCGICLSDVHLIDGSIPAPKKVITPGHESAGVVTKVGELVEGWQEGDPVVIMAGRNCMRCARCRGGRFEQCLALELMGFHYDGAWAEYVVVPFFALSRAPKGIDLEQAAILVDAVATPYAALSERAALRPGETVGLWGIGGLGTHAVQIARLLGASLIVAIDPLPSARERALKLGADVALDPGEVDVEWEMRSLTDDLGLDVAVDLVGSNEVLKQAVGSLARGGRAVMVGLSMEPIQLEPSILFGVQRHALLGHLGYAKRHLDELIKLLETHRLDLSASISDIISLTEIAEGVRRLAEKDGDPVRIVVQP